MRRGVLVGVLALVAAALPSVALAAYPDTIRADGPAAYWRLDETSGTTAADSSGSGLPGTYVGSPVLGQPGGVSGGRAASFNGTSQYVRVPYAARLNPAQFSVEAWADVTGGAGTYRAVVNSRNIAAGSGATAGFILYASSSDTWQLFLGNGTSGWSTLRGPAVSTGTWTHLVATYDGTTASLYVNGALAASATTPFSPNTAQDLRIGAGGTSGPNFYFPGLIDDVAVYGSVLSAAAVQAHYAAASGGGGTPPPDPTPPDTTISSGPSGTVASASASFAFSSTESGSTFACALDGSAFSACTSPKAYTGLADGSHTFQVRATDAAGNVDPTPASATWTVDTTPPDTSITSGPSGTVAPATYSFGFASTETGSTFACSLDGVAFSACTSPQSYSGLAAGTHTFQVRATDAAGNVDPTPASRTWTVASSSPPPPSGSYAQAVLAEHPAAYWRLGESSGTTMIDSSGAGLTGSYVGSPSLGQAGALPGDPDTAVALNGSTQYGQVPYRAALNGGAFSVEAWADVGGGAGTYRAVVSSRNTASGSAGYILYAAANDTWQFWLGNSSSWVTVRGPAVAIGQWTHLVGTFDGTTASLYVNGVLAGSATVSGYLQNASQPLRVGAGATGTPQFYFPGTVDEVSVYGSPLSAAAAAAHYQAGVGGAAPPPSGGGGGTTGDPLLLAAGDVAYCPSSASASGAAQTAQLLGQFPGAPIAVLGDGAYESGTSAEYQNCFQPTWGQYKPQIHPAPGYHDYNTANAAGYFGYWGSQAGDSSKGYYSYDIGTWHVVVLNSPLCDAQGCTASNAQVQWLQSDLAAHPAPCTLAYFAYPLFTSGTTDGPDPGMKAFWNALYAAGADVILNGHEHSYERFAPQTPSGAADASNGIREFVVGTGGRTEYDFGAPAANSQLRYNGSYGILKLTLHASGYDWQFIPTAGATFSDSGSGTCH